MKRHIDIAEEGADFDSLIESIIQERENQSASANEEKETFERNSKVESDFYSAFCDDLSSVIDDEETEDQHSAVMKNIKRLETMCSLKQIEKEKDPLIMDSFVPILRLDDRAAMGNTSIPVSVPEFINKARGLAKLSAYEYAIKVCLKGLLLFPGNVDLLADLIFYSLRKHDLEAALSYYETLKASTPFDGFTKRAFSSSIELLLCFPNKYDQECRDLVELFLEKHPEEDLAYRAKADIESSKGNEKKAKEVLLMAVKKLRNAPQCGLRLAIICLNQGCYEEAVDAAKYCLAASGSPYKEGVDIVICNVVEAFARDALLHEKWRRSESSVSLAEIKHLRDHLTTIMEMVSSNDYLVGKLRQRICELDILSHDVQGAKLRRDKSGLGIKQLSKEIPNYLSKCTDLCCKQLVTHSEETKDPLTKSKKNSWSLINHVKNQIGLSISIIQKLFS